MRPQSSQLQLFEEVRHDLGASEIVDRLGVSHFEVNRPVDLEQLRRLAEEPGLDVDVRMGTSMVRFGSSAPTDTDRELVRPLLGDVATAISALDSISSGYDLVGLVRKHIDGAKVAIRRSGWVRTTGALLQVFDEDWLSLSEQANELGFLRVGENEIRLRRTEVAAGRSKLELIGKDVTELEPAALQALEAVCDAHAWRSLATSEMRESTTLLLALHHDQEPCVVVEPSAAAGATALLEWTYVTDDANRVEALRQVLRSATVTARSELPDAQAVRRLAEHQRIALARDNAAAVQRAVSEAHRDTSEALRSASDGLAEVTDTSVKAVYGAVIAAIGVVAFAGRSADSVSELLTWFAALAVVFGLVVVAITSLQRIADYSQQIDSLRERIVNDPLTPQVDRDRALDRIRAFEPDKRETSARRRTALLALAGSGVIVAAALSLTLGVDTSEAPQPDPSPPSSPSS